MTHSVYPDNRIGKFTTLLARELALDGEYEVGLSECIIPVPNRSLNFTQPIIYNEKGATVGIGYFHIDASEINSLTDWADQDLKLPKTKLRKDIFSFSTRERRVDDCRPRMRM